MSELRDFLSVPLLGMGGEQIFYQVILHIPQH
jgi:hypothetical protein